MTNCANPLGETPTLLMVLLFVLLVVMRWGYNQVLLGVLRFCIWVPLRRQSCRQTFSLSSPTEIVVADLITGAPDPKYGKIAKLRSTHNNYLTLPVIFFMLSNHCPLAFASGYG